MAELSAPTSPCCSTDAQATCCEPSEKAACCDTSAAHGGCGCSAGQPDDIRERVRERYAAAARSAAAHSAAPVTLPGADPGVFGATLYDTADAEGAPEAAVSASLGCGVPTAVADLHPGETVLDLGSGAGADALISAGRVAPGGRAIGIDMTQEMLALARANAAEAGVENVEFLRGYLEDIPLLDASVDVVISNCVINLAADKRVVLAEAARVLKPGGRFAVTDVIADGGMDDATRAEMQQWTGCIAGALTEAEFRSALADVGLSDVQIRPTHRVHEHAISAIIRARKPSESHERSVPAECRLDTDGGSRQLERYRALGHHVTAVQRRPGRLAVRFGAGYDAAVLREAVDVERDCCPFLSLEARLEDRELVVSVAASEHDPALDAIADALGGVRG